jgi:iron complex transport system permease protein
MALLVLSVVVAFFVGNFIGTMKIGVAQILAAIAGDHETAQGMVVWNIRLPRMILAGLVGINLALAGAVLQGVMKNPLADPSIIGISSGAGLFGIFILVILPQYQNIVPIAAFCGALLRPLSSTAWPGRAASRRRGSSSPAWRYRRSSAPAISATLVFFSDRVHGALTFMNGSLSSRSWPEVWTILPYTVVGVILVLLLAGKMNILILGDEVARGLGLNVEVTRLGFTALAALLAASAVSVVGLLGFVGLIVPHSIRLILGNDYKHLLPASALLGAALVMFSDTFARTVFSPRKFRSGSSWRCSACRSSSTF